VLTYANQLTILRLIFIPFFVLLVIYGKPRIATMIFVIAGLTDALDGLLARKLQQKTVLGSFLDPMADKLLLTASFITLSLPSAPVVLHIPLWLTIITISRDLLIALFALIMHLQTGYSKFPPTFLGKCTTTAQLFTVGTCMLANFTNGATMVIFMPVVYSALLLTVASGLHYFYRSVRLIEEFQRSQAANGTKRDQD
jgi:cardiolipin synthase